MDSSGQRRAGSAVIWTSDWVGVPSRCRWVALVPSVSGVGKNKIAIKFVTSVWAASAGSRDTPLADRYLGVNRGLRRLRGHSNHENAEVF